MSAAWRIILAIVAISVAMLPVAIAGCGGDGDEEQTYPPGFIDEGGSLYSTHCASCHGPNAEGTEIAEGIAGKSGNKVAKYVREGEGDEMPAFTTDEITDEELNKIGAFVASR